MALSESQLDAVERKILELRESREPLVPGLRSTFPEIVFLRCEASDMDASPYRKGTNHQLHLIDRSEMCITLTDRLEQADGLVIAELEAS
ncbi:MAG: hypothetical protein HKL98_03775 [Burkholderiales bacterium]|nr:hypothetical protein [Burkholderiales bacterium]